MASSDIFLERVLRPDVFKLVDTRAVGPGNNAVIEDRTGLSDRMPFWQMQTSMAGIRAHVATVFDGTPPSNHHADSLAVVRGAIEETLGPLTVATLRTTDISASVKLAGVRLFVEQMKRIFPHAESYVRTVCTAATNKMDDAFSRETSSFDPAAMTTSEWITAARTSAANRLDGEVPRNVSAWLFPVEAKTAFGRMLDAWFTFRFLEMVASSEKVDFFNRRYATYALHDQFLAAVKKIRHMSPNASGQARARSMIADIESNVNTSITNFVRTQGTSEETSNLFSQVTDAAASSEMSVLEAINIEKLYKRRHNLASTLHNNNLVLHQQVAVARRGYIAWAIAYFIALVVAVALLAAGRSKAVLIQTCVILLIVGLYLVSSYVARRLRR